MNPLSNYIKRRRVIRTLCELVKVNTENPPGLEGNIVVPLGDLLKDLGADVELQEVMKNRPNVIASLGDRNSRRSIILCTHTDVVPTGDVRRWRFPPFSGRVSRHRVYGRGACDAKGALAAMIEAMRAFADSNLEGRVMLAAVMGEEDAESKGARHALELGLKGNCAIIGEPTNLRVETAHKGGIRPRITVYGRAAHASSPERGINAIKEMMKLIRALEKHAREVRRRKHPLLGGASLTVTLIKGGDRINVIPEECSIHIDRRLIPGETPEAAKEELKNTVEQIIHKLKIKAEVKIETKYPPAEVSESELIVKLAREAAEEITGVKQKPSGFKAGCDMWVFTKNGIPAVILGPGSLNEAHTINEFVEIDQVLNCARIYSQIIEKSLRAN
ncbi:MAG: M20 family metallopeptidase [Halobacteria archaeon]